MICLSSTFRTFFLFTDFSSLTHLLFGYSFASSASIFSLFERYAFLFLCFMFLQVAEWQIKKRMYKHLYITLYNWNTFRKRFVHNKYYIQNHLYWMMNKMKGVRVLPSVLLESTWFDLMKLIWFRKKITTFWTKQIDFTTKIHKICR